MAASQEDISLADETWPRQEWLHYSWPCERSLTWVARTPQAHEMRVSGDRSMRRSLLMPQSGQVPADATQVPPKLESEIDSSSEGRHSWCEADEFPLESVDDEMCHLCNGPERVMVWQGLNVWAEFGFTTYLGTVTIHNQVYVRTVRICHRCIEPVPGLSQDEDAYFEKFRLESATMATMCTSIFDRLDLVEAVAVNIIEFLFEKQSGHGDGDDDRSTSSNDVDRIPALVDYFSGGKEDFAMHIAQQQQLKLML